MNIYKKDVPWPPCANLMATLFPSPVGRPQEFKDHRTRCIYSAAGLQALPALNPSTKIVVCHPVSARASVSSAEPGGQDTHLGGAYRPLP